MVELHHVLGIHGVVSPTEHFQEAKAVHSARRWDTFTLWGSLWKCKRMRLGKGHNCSHCAMLAGKWPVVGAWVDPEVDLGSIGTLAGLCDGLRLKCGGLWSKPVGLCIGFHSSHAIVGECVASQSSVRC